MLTVHSMSLSFSVNIHLDGDDLAAISQRGFICCEAIPVSPTLAVQRLAFCLHCKSLMTYCGALKHSRSLLTKHNIDLSRYFDVHLVETYRKRILSEVECRFEDGLCPTIRTPSNRQGRVRHRTTESEVSPSAASERDVETIPTIEPSSRVSLQQVDSQEGQEPNDPRSDHDCDCVAECLLNASNRSCFDERRFLDIANAALERVSNKNDMMKQESTKSRIVSLMLKRLATQLSLSKTQTNAMVNFFKAALVFISPESENTSKKIMASYDSCQRQS